MKKITLLTILSVFTLNYAIAQAKLGHINAQEILMLMPEYKAAEIDLQKHEKKLQTQLEASYAEFQKKEEEFKANESTYDELIRNDKLNALQELVNRIQKFERDAQSSIQKKQEELLIPINKKLMDAIQKVSEEGGFTYIFTAEILYSASENNDIGPLVKKQLGI
tara:strand:+ start:378 stop:872 length:495 start_codon:yes stop_codon:yes gene_type:complete